MPGALRSLARLLLSRDPGSLVADFYRYADPIFAGVTEGSGLIDIGWAPDPATADLAEAQRALVRKATDGLPMDGHWLESGSGWGGPAALLAREHPALRITGLDLAPDHLAAARARAEAAGLAERVRHHLGDAQAMPFADASFDAVYAIETAFHYPRKAAFAREVARVLRPGGGLRLVDFVLQPEHTGRLERLALGPNLRIGAMGGLCTATGWCHLLAEAGLDRIEVEDLSAGSIGLLGRWAERIEAQREALRVHYPRPLLAYYSVGLRRLAARAPHAPVGYVLLRARKPAAGQPTSGAPRARAGR
ncbi:MAG: methyltransferase domain-containing protein [Pseudomonadota bacterium]